MTTDSEIPIPQRPLTVTNAEFDKFFIALGIAVTGWQYVEIHLFLIYARLMRSQNPRAMSAAFHSVINFQTRLSMVDSAMQVQLDKVKHKKLLQGWAILHKRLRKRVSRRNDFVHFMLNIDETGSKTILQSSIADLRSKDKKSYDAKQIGEASESFKNLQSELSAFNDALGKAIKPPYFRKSRARAESQS